MKKMLSSILALCIMCVCFTGCSTEDIGYLSMVEEISELKSYELNADMSLEITDELKDMLITATTENAVKPSETNEKIKNLGIINITLNGNVNIEKSYMNLDLNISEKSFGFDESVSLYFTEGGVFVSKENLVDLYVLYLEQTTVFGRETLNSIAEESKKELVGVEYVCIDTTNVFADKDELLKMFKDELELSSGDLATIDFFELVSDIEFLSGFKTDFVKRIENGYEITLTPESILKVFKSIVSYIAENENKIYETLLSDDQMIELKKYKEKLELQAEHIKKIDEYQKQLEENKELMTADEVADNMGNKYDELTSELDCIMYQESNYVQTLFDIVEMIKELSEYLESSDMEELSAYIKMIDGTKFVNSLTKKDGVYTDNDSIEIYYSGLKMLSVYGKSEIKIKDVEPKIISGVLAEECVDILEKASYKVNPVDYAEGQWDKGVSKGVMDLEIARREGTDSIVIDYLLLEDRIYLPLRKICEAYGEEVVWDATLNKAYIVRGNEKIDMTGTIYNDRTFIKIRDFEKLGYIVEYKETDLYNVFTLSSKKYE